MTIKFNNLGYAVPNATGVRCLIQVHITDRYMQARSKVRVVTVVAVQVKTILTNINGQAQPGQLLAVMGASGSGKTVRSTGG